MTTMRDLASPNPSPGGKKAIKRALRAAANDQNMLMVSKTPREILTRLDQGKYLGEDGVDGALADLKGAVLAQIPVTRIEYHDAYCDAYKGSEWCHCPGKSAAETREALDAFRKAILTMFEGE